MLKQVIPVIFLFLLSFEGFSYHYNQYGVDTTYNSKHDLIGIEYRVDNYSIGYISFINSNYKSSKMIKINYMFDCFGFNLFRVSGYPNFSMGIIPVYQLRYKNIEIEASYLPGLNGKNKTHLITISKKVIF